MNIRLLKMCPWIYTTEGKPFKRGAARSYGTILRESLEADRRFQETVRKFKEAAHDHAAHKVPGDRNPL